MVSRTRTWALPGGHRRLGGADERRHVLLAQPEIESSLSQVISDRL
jgi:hypothetical protein